MLFLGRLLDWLNLIKPASMSVHPSVRLYIHKKVSPIRMTFDMLVEVDE